jgi:hypothetical protein
MHSFGRETLWIDGCRPLGKLGVDMRIILKWIFKDWNGGGINRSGSG